MNRALFGENVKCQHIEDKSQIRKISGKNSNFLASVCKEHFVKCVKADTTNLFPSKVIIRIEILSHENQLSAISMVDRQQSSLCVENLKQLLFQLFITEKAIMKSLEIHDACFGISKIDSGTNLGSNLNCLSTLITPAHFNIAVGSKDLTQLIPDLFYQCHINTSFLDGYTILVFYHSIIQKSIKKIIKNKKK